MACDFFSLATPGVRGLHPYQPGKPLDELEREYGITNAVKLASNENPLGPSGKVIAAIEQTAKVLSRYPDGNGFILKQALADKLNLDIGQITLGNGSNDVLELIARAYLTTETEVIFSQYAFAVYPIVTQAVGAKAIVVAAKAWGHDLSAMLAAITDKTRLIFIANPNNPTGTWVNNTDLVQFLDAVPESVMVVLDEAYFEYTRASESSDPEYAVEGYPDGMALLDSYPNLVVTRTFSKAYGLAGLRVGYAVANADISDILNRVRQPFNVNQLALVAATAALEDEDYLIHSVRLNYQQMQIVVKGLYKLGIEYIPSTGNFVSIRVGDGLACYDRLLHEGVIVRPLANYDMSAHLRVSIGTAEENQRMLTALGKIL